MQVYETFVDHSTHLGYLYVAASNAELSNKMTLCI
jgi:hypothetical protein